MTPADFLKRLCEGYIRAYRTLNQHKTSTWTDVTQGELGFFARLGEMLGYRARLDHQRMDLSWYDPDTDKLILYLERETKRSRVMTETLRKLLGPRGSEDADYLVAVLGWVADSDLPEIRAKIENKLGERSLLVVSWVGSSKNAPSTHIEAFVYSQRQVSHRSAKPKLDKDDYWYIKFSSRWEPV